MSAQAAPFMDMFGITGRHLQICYQFKSNSYSLFSPRVKSQRLRCTLIALMALMTLALPVWIMQESVAFYQEGKLITAVDWKRAKSIKYPNITICDAKYFSVRKMNGKNK